MKPVRARSSDELCLHFRRAQSIGRIGSWEWCLEDNEMWWSEETYRLFQFDPETVPSSQQAFWEAIHDEDQGPLRIAIGRAIDESSRFELECRVSRGEERYVLLQGEVHDDPETRQRWLCGTARDVTEQRQAQEQITRLANFDSLTGLANRRFFHDLLDRAIEDATERLRPIALLYLDLDGFKRVNDTLGHAAGDELLREIATRLRANVRGCDVISRVDRPNKPSSVSRLGGDEFTILLTELESADHADRVARRILRALPEAVHVEGREVFVTGSIGIAVYPQDGTDSKTLLKHADTAMYHAKSQGRNNFQFFSPQMNATAMRRLTIEGRLRRALENEELELHYQPKLDLATERIVGAEALLRWEFEELGAISPRELIPIAEETGLIRPLGAWVIDRACRQIREWMDAGYAPLPIAVNVSSRQFVGDELVKRATDSLRGANLEPSSLEIEITESLLLQDDEATALVLRDLRAIGVRIALDDFGTGYSSLSYLTRFQLDTLKLDRAFVRDIDSDPSAANVARAVVDLAHGLGLVCVAEGVDSQTQMNLLHELGCDQIQGFLLSPALPAVEFESLLSRRR